eukprot:1146914-Pelagomonas_calceolata.AAC.11
MHAQLEGPSEAREAGRQAACPACMECSAVQQSYEPAMCTQLEGLGVGGEAVGQAALPVWHAAQLHAACRAKDPLLVVMVKHAVSVQNFLDTY